MGCERILIQVSNNENELFFIGVMDPSINTSHFDVVNCKNHINIILIFLSIWWLTLILLHDFDNSSYKIVMHLRSGSIMHTTYQHNSQYYCMKIEQWTLHKGSHQNSTEKKIDGKICEWKFDGKENQTGEMNVIWYIISIKLNKSGS